MPLGGGCSDDGRRAGHAGAVALRQLLRRGVRRELTQARCARAVREPAPPSRWGRAPGACVVAAALVVPVAVAWLASAVGAAVQVSVPSRSRPRGWPRYQAPRAGAVNCIRRTRVPFGIACHFREEVSSGDNGDIHRSNRPAEKHIVQKLAPMSDSPRRWPRISANPFPAHGALAPVHSLPPFSVPAVAEVRAGVSQARSLAVGGNGSRTLGYLARARARSVGRTGTGAHRSRDSVRCSGGTWPGRTVLEYKGEPRIEPSRRAPVQQANATGRERTCHGGVPPGPGFCGTPIRQRRRTACRPRPGRLNPYPPPRAIPCA